MTNFRLPTIHPESYNRFNRLDSPRIAVATTGSNHGRVYVTFTSEVAPAPIPGTVGWWTRLRWTRRMAAKPSALLSGANRVLPIWADGRNGIPDTFFAPFLGPGK
jgi:hypothetical protein